MFQIGDRRLSGNGGLLMFGSTVVGGGHVYAGIMTEEREHNGALDTVGSMPPSDVLLSCRRNAASGPRETGIILATARERTSKTIHTVGR